MLVSAPEEVEEEERQDSGTGEEEEDSGGREKEEDSGMGEEGEEGKEGTAPENGRNEKLGEYRCSCTPVSIHFGREGRV